MNPTLAPNSPHFSDLASPAWTAPLMVAAVVLVLVAGLLVFFAASARAQAKGSDVAAASEEKTSYDVILSEMGINKIQVIKQVREAVPGLGLAETKALVESAPIPIKQGVTRSQAEAIKQKVESAGAKVTIKSGGLLVPSLPVGGPVSEENYDVILLEMGTNKISVIKELRESVPGLGLAEAKMLAESAPKPIKLGVTKTEAEAIRQRVEAAGAKVSIRAGDGKEIGGSAGAASGSDISNCDVILLELGLNKISVIKEVRDAVPGLGLAEAKHLVETAPQTIKRGVARDQAEAIKRRVEAAGAKVVIK